MNMDAVDVIMLSLWGLVIAGWIIYVVYEFRKK